MKKERRKNEKYTPIKFDEVLGSDFSLSLLSKNVNILPEFDSYKCMTDSWIGSFCQWYPKRWCFARTKILVVHAVWPQYSNYGRYCWHLRRTSMDRATIICLERLCYPRTFANDRHPSYRWPLSVQSIRGESVGWEEREHLIYKKNYNEAGARCSISCEIPKLEQCVKVLTRITSMATCKFGSSSLRPARSVCS